MGAIRKVGVSFTNGKFQLAEIEHSKKTTVTALGEAETAVDFANEGKTLSANHPKLRGFVGELSSLIKSLKVEAETISFALPTQMLFLTIVPNDEALEGETLKEYVNWEIGNYLEDDPNSKEIIVNSTPLQSPLGGIKQMLIVSLKRSTVGFIQKVCAELGMKRDKVEIDHLSVEKSIVFNYPEVKGYPAALVGVKSNYIDASLLVGGETIDYRNYAGSDVRKAVLDYVKYLNERDSAQSPAALFLYGLDVPADLRQQLRKEADVQVVQMNILRKLTPPKKIDKNYLKVNPQFAAAVGLALRID
jgi:Tfp pilus assembly PilM family ATPase